MFTNYINWNILYNIQSESVFFFTAEAYKNMEMRHEYIPTKKNHKHKDRKSSGSELALVIRSCDVITRAPEQEVVGL